MEALSQPLNSIWPNRQSLFASGRTGELAVEMMVNCGGLSRRLDMWLSATWQCMGVILVFNQEQHAALMELIRISGAYMKVWPGLPHTHLSGLMQAPEAPMMEPLGPSKGQQACVSLVGEEIRRQVEATC
mmetsp:Transcript_27150/g.71444  ORF Transcript_27150/g.71444 Transcript_27150/m.71444 type:complete len:130 (-) Transcript_27150:302-691(-)